MRCQQKLYSQNAAASAIASAIMTLQNAISIHYLCSN